jgi:hypothetical protein
LRGRSVPSELRRAASPRHARSSASTAKNFASICRRAINAKTGCTYWSQNVCNRENDADCNISRFASRACVER